MTTAEPRRPTVYLVRHGETDWNVRGVLQGHRDIPLNDNGRAQAAHAGAVLAELLARDNIQAADHDFHCSPIGRARQTMTILREVMGRAEDGVCIDPRLAEITFGDWEGYTLAQLRERDPQRMSVREHDKWNFQPPGGESYRDGAVRVGAWYDGLTGDVIAVTHGGIARGLMVHLGVARAAAAPLVDVRQGVVYRLSPGTMTIYS